MPGAREVFVRTAAPLFEIGDRDLEGSIHALVERVAAIEPDRLAVKARDRSLTYGELDARANAVAHGILERLGEGREPIAVFCEKTVELAVAMLAVLKSGKFYVPLDVTADNNAVLAEAHPRMVLDAALIAELSAAPRPRHKPTVSFGELAMVLYTSGSTGRPKGVMQSHRNFVSDLKQVIATGRYRADDRAIVLPAVTFIGANALIFAALASGAVIYLFDLRSEGWEALKKTIEREQITIYHSTGTVFYNLTNELTDRREVASVRLVRLAGEAIFKRELDRYKAWFHDECVFANALGTTETNIIRQFFADKKTELRGNIVPAGYAVPTKEILLYADDGGPAQPGEVGEIAVRSRFLSLGYYKRADLTEQVFVELGGGDRLYHTGDYGRFLPDGCLEYLGRNDSQIKLFGKKIPLPEIEGALLNHPAIKEASVSAKELRPGDRRLVAYFAGPRGSFAALPSPSELRQYLSRELPSWMMPHALVPLEELPRTANGKVALDRLPLPKLQRPELATPFREVSSMVAAVIADLWAKILLLDRVGADDEFLELGGNSVLATMIAARLKEIFDAELSVKDMFEMKSVARLAALLEERSGGRLEGELEKLLAEGEGS